MSDYSHAPHAIPVDAAVGSDIPQVLQAEVSVRRVRCKGHDFDYRYGPYAEIGFLWSAVDRHGPGCLLPEPLIEVEDASARPPDAIHLSFLVMSQTDPERLQHLARFSAVVRSDSTAEDPSRRAIKRLAVRALDPWTLFRLSMRKWAWTLRRRGEEKIYDC